MEKLDLKNDYDYFLKEFKNLYKIYPNKYLIVKDKKIEGAFNSFEDAFNAAIKKFKVGTFLIQKCSEDEIKSQNFYSYQLIRV